MRSYYFPIIALIGVLLACPLYAQQDDAPPAVVTTEIGAEDAAEDSEIAEANDVAENGEAPETTAEAENVDDAETENVAIDLDDPDDIDLDDQTYEEDDDDFVPTQEIPADTPIAFPSNI